MSNNTQQPEVKKVIGTISISYHVYCPHCNAFLDDYYDREWWNKSIDMSDGPGVDQEVTCPKCEKEFEINGFEY